MHDIELSNIYFKYNKTQDLFSGLSLSFDKAQSTFVLGPNGSGKSSLVKLIFGNLQPSSGVIQILQKSNPSQKFRTSKIGYVPQSQSLDKEMWVKDIFTYIGSFYRLKKDHNVYMQGLIDSLDISNLLDKRIKNLSGGQKQIVNIAIGLIHDPEIVLLDEPFTGLDYDKISRILGVLRGTDKTYVYITHDYELAEKYSDQIILMNQGKVIESNTADNLVKSHQYVVKELEFKDLSKLREQIKFSEGINYSITENKLSIVCKHDQNNLTEVDGFIKKFDSGIRSIHTIQNNLKSTLIGLHNITISATEKPNQNKEKKGKGSGKGKNKQK